MCLFLRFSLSVSNSQKLKQKKLKVPSQEKNNEKNLFELFFFFSLQQQITEENLLEHLP